MSWFDNFVLFVAGILVLGFGGLTVLWVLNELLDGLWTLYYVWLSGLFVVLIDSFWVSCLMFGCVF